MFIELTKINGKNITLKLDSIMAFTPLEEEFLIDNEITEGCSITITSLLTFYVIDEYNTIKQLIEFAINTQGRI